jgi:uncharacterized protein involved in exopolysaccharide biosynthesis
MIAAENMPRYERDGIDLIALVRVVWSYKWLVSGIALLASLVAVALALTATPVYRAEVVITEAQEQGMGGVASLANQLGGLASLAGVSIGGKGQGRESLAILQSRRLIEEYIQRNALSPQLLSGSDKATLWFAVERFQRDVLSIREDSRKGVTTVTVDWTDAATAATWANGFVALANESIRKRALDDSSRNIAYLNEQLAQTSVVELRRVLFNLIENETKTHMLANGRTEYAFRVVDPATVSEGRISPRRTLMVLVGLIVGFAIGVVAALSHNLMKPHAPGKA